MAELILDMTMNLKRFRHQWRGRSIALWLTCAVCLDASAQIRTADNENFDIRRDATVVAVEQALPSVVNIATKSLVQVRDPFDAFYPFIQRQPSYQEYYSLGSGVVIDEAGYLLTNDHVVRRADEIAVQFSTLPNPFSATVVASDAKRDIALLKIN